MADILVWPNKVLGAKCSEVVEFNDELKALAKTMVSVLETGIAAGLAAPQIGEPVRLVVIEKEETGEKLVLVNPTVEPASEEGRGASKVEVSVEWCLSLPGVSAHLKNVRYMNVRVAAQGLDGMPVVLTLKGRDAVAVQHEVDHLDGITLLDRLSPLKKRLAKSRLLKRAKEAKRLE